jgi:uncharacterized protein YegL
MPRPIFFLLDRSGSMDLARSDTIGGFNAFLSDQRGLNPDTLMTLWQFDHEILKSYTNMPLRDVQSLDFATFQPRGSTHLLDTIGEALDAGNPIGEPPIVVIFTDGQENGSHKYTKSQIKEKIGEKTSEGWTFIYLGANQDAFAEAGGLGIGGDTTYNFDQTNTPNAFRSLSATVSQQV